MSDLPNLDPVAQPNTDPPNRGLENRFDANDAAQIKVTLMQIDETIIKYITDTINPTIVDNDREIPVPVMFATPERWKTIRKDGYLRDTKNDRLQTPLILLRRRGINRNPLTNPSNKYVYMTHTAQWNARNAYDRFAVQNNVRPSNELRKVIVPDYIDLSYEILIWTEYVEQMNSVIEQINVENDEYWGYRNQYKFRVKISEFVSQTDLPVMKERVVRNTFNMAVSAYLVPERYIKDFATKSTNFKEFTVKKVVITDEVDMTGENMP